MAKWIDKYGTGHLVLKAGDIEIDCNSHRKPYKDGTQLWVIWLRVNGSSSKEIITIAQVRGTFEDAQRKAEEFVQKIREDLV